MERLDGTAARQRIKDAQEMPMRKLPQPRGYDPQGRAHIAAMSMGGVMISAGAGIWATSRKPNIGLCAAALTAGVCQALAGFMIGHTDRLRGFQIAAGTSLVSSAMLGVQFSQAFDKGITQLEVLQAKEAAKAQEYIAKGREVPKPKAIDPQSTKATLLLFKRHRILAALTGLNVLAAMYYGQKLTLPAAAIEWRRHDLGNKMARDLGPPPEERWR